VPSSAEPSLGQDTMDFMSDIEQHCSWLAFMVSKTESIYVYNLWAMASVSVNKTLVTKKSGNFILIITYSTQ